MNGFWDLFQHKKGIALIIGAIIGCIAPYLNIDNERLALILGFLASFEIGQGIADLKSKAPKKK